VSVLGSLRGRARRPLDRLVRAGYLLVLRREPDPGGAALHAAAMARGRSFADLLEDLAGSDEFATAHPPVESSPHVAELMCRVAHAVVLRRDADADAVAHWRRELEQGASWQSLVSGMLASPEFTEIAESGQGLLPLSMLWRIDELLQTVQHHDERLAALERAVQRLSARAWDGEAVARRLGALEDRRDAAAPER
jgi:hypothetical protein